MNTAMSVKEKVGTQLGRVIGDAGDAGGASADHLRTKKFSRQQEKQTKAGGLSAEVVEKAKEGSWLAAGGLA